MVSSFCYNISVVNVQIVSSLIYFISVDQSFDMVSIPYKVNYTYVVHKWFEKKPSIITLWSELYIATEPYAHQSIYIWSSKINNLSIINVWIVVRTHIQWNLGLNLHFPNIQLSKCYCECRNPKTVTFSATPSNNWNACLTFRLIGLIISQYRG